MTPKRMNTILIGILVVLVLLTGAGIFFANKQLTNTANETAKLSADIEVSKKQIDTYGITKIKVDSLDYVGDLANKVLPESQEQSVVVAEISQFAQRSRLTLAGIEFVEKPSSRSSKSKKSTVPKGVVVTPIIVKFSGVKYEQLLEFLRTIESNQRKMQVTSINLEPNEEDRSILTEVSVAINLYVKKPDTAAEKKK